MIASDLNELVDFAVDIIKRSQRAPRIVIHDLGHDPSPRLNSDGATAPRAQTQETAEQAKAQASSNLLICELAAADTVVIGAPIYNFGMRSTLKSWFAFVLKAGVMFSFTETAQQV